MLAMQVVDQPLDQRVAALLHHREQAHLFLEHVQFQVIADGAQGVDEPGVDATRLHICRQGQQWSVLIVSTLAFTVCFMVWMMFGVIGIPLKKTLGLNATEFGLLTATPVLTGSLIRVPLGIWTDRYGGRIVMALLMAATVPAIWLMSYATAYWHFLVIGLFVGLAGGSFSVGTPYVARWFPKAPPGHGDGRVRRRQLGLGRQQVRAPACWWHRRLDAGAAGLCRHHAGHGDPVLVLGSSSDPKHLVPSNVKFSDQLKMLKDPKVLKYCQYYSIVFGGYVALACGWCSTTWASSAWTSAAALLAACFSPARRRAARHRRLAVGQVRRAQVTWWVLWVSWICLFLLSYPQTDFTISPSTARKTFHIGLNVYAFTALMFIWASPGPSARPASSSTSATTTPGTSAPSAASSAWPAAWAASCCRSCSAR
jgi:NNP family nitrate/nitrite transporter-like MFS transporter